MFFDDFVLDQCCSYSLWVRHSRGALSQGSSEILQGSSNTLSGCFQGLGLVVWGKTSPSSKDMVVQAGLLASSLFVWVPFGNS